MTITRLLKALLVVAAVTLPMLAASVGWAESGAHRGDGNPPGDVRSK